MADTVVVTAPDANAAVLTPTLSDAIAAAQNYLAQILVAQTQIMNIETIVNAAETVALAAAASAQASANAAAASASGSGVSTTVALLGAGTEGARAFATNGRKIGESVGNGSGVPVYFSTGVWRVVSSDQPVLA